jgi:hypothetical protein
MPSVTLLAKKSISSTSPVVYTAFGVTIVGQDLGTTVTPTPSATPQTVQTPAASTMMTTSMGLNTTVGTTTVPQSSAVTVIASSVSYHAYRAPIIPPYTNLHNCTASRMDNSSFASMVVSGRADAAADPGGFLDLKCLDFSDAVYFVPNTTSSLDTSLTGICKDPNSVIPHWQANRKMNPKPFMIL